MPYVRPTLEELRARIAASVEGKTQMSAGRGSPLAPFVDVLAGVSHGMYAYLDWQARQLSDDTCDDDVLITRAAEFGVYRIAAVSAMGLTVALSGTDGAVIPAGALLQSDAGQRYRVDVEQVIAGGVAVVAVTAVEPGAAGNLAAGAGLALVQSIAGVDSGADVAGAGITGGADIETISRLRERLRDRKANPPMGGSRANYVSWTRAAHADIGRVWVYEHENGNGSVVVRFVLSNAASPIPAPSHVTAVESYINQMDVRPAGLLNFEAVAPVAHAVNIAFSSLTPNSAAVRADIAACLTDMLYRVGEPGGLMPLRRIEQAIRQGGADDFAINIVADVALAANHFPVLGTVTWPS